ncbi:hypothetical protein ACLB2K_016158 [Fragaria x ananassa]
MDLFFFWVRLENIPLKLETVPEIIKDAAIVAGDKLISSCGPATTQFYKRGTQAEASSSVLRSLFTSKATLKRKPIVLKKSSLEAVAPQIRLGVLKEIDTNCQKVLCDENDRISKNASIPKDMIPDEPPITVMDSTIFKNVAFPIYFSSLSAGI